MKKIMCLFMVLVLLPAVALAPAPGLIVEWQTSADTFNPGSDGTVSLTISNSETATVTNTKITIIAGPGIDITTGRTITLGSLSGGSSQTTSFGIKIRETAGSATSYVNLDIDYYTGSSQGSKNVYIPITIRRTPMLQITNVVFDGETEPGSRFSLAFDIWNFGQGPAKDVHVSVNQTSGLFTTASTSGETMIRNIDSSGWSSVEFPIVIDPGADPGIYVIPITLEYKDDTRSESYTDQKSIGFTVAAEPDLIVNLENEKDLYAGSVSTAKISVANRGAGKARSMTIFVSSEFGKKEIYVGSVDNDDFETVTFDINLAGAQKKQYGMDLNITYEDEYNNDFFVEKRITFTPSSAPLPWGYMIFFLAAGSAVYWFYRRKKRKK